LAGFLKKALGMWALARLWLGKLLGLLHVPGVVVAQTYEANIARATVRVRLGPLFTVVSVNRMDIYFHRLTGRIDGVGVSPGPGDRSDEIER
jgi:hypothetical protein